MAKITQAQAKYIQWLQRNDPFLLDVAIKRATGKNVNYDALNGIADIFGSIKDIDFGKIVTAVTDTATKLAQTKAQVNVIKAQTQRAIKGEPPIDMNYYPTSVNYNAQSPEGQYAVNTVAAKFMGQNGNGGGSINWLPLVALGIGGAILIMFLTKPKAA